MDNIYSRVSIIRNCGEHFNKPESPLERMKFAFEVNMAYKNRPQNHDISNDSIKNVILAQKMNSTKQDFK